MGVFPWWQDRQEVNYFSTDSLKLTSTQPPPHNSPFHLYTLKTLSLFSDKSDLYFPFQTSLSSTLNLPIPSDRFHSQTDLSLIENFIVFVRNTIQWTLSFPWELIINPYQISLRVRAFYISFFKSSKRAGIVLSSYHVTTSVCYCGSF